MFDLRYHVASLAAVFVALVLGIFVGVGLSGRGFVSDAERENLQAQIDGLSIERDEALARIGDADLRGEAFDDFVRVAYPELVRDRLDGLSIALVFVGSVDQGLADTVRRSIADAGGRVSVLRALRVPLQVEAVDGRLGAGAETRELAGAGNRERLGREVARELVAAGPNPVLELVAAELVEEQSGTAAAALDGVVVARPAPPQGGETQEFLSGLYAGFAAFPGSAVGVDTSDANAPAAPVFRQRGLGTVSGVDATSGQIALVFLLAGARPGSYGAGENAVDGTLPAPPPLPTPVAE